MRFIPLMIIVLLVPSTGTSATIYVPDHYTSIQQAIDAAVHGDTVIVKPGTYVENIIFLGKKITVISEQGPNVTVIDGGSPPHPDYGSTVTFQNGENNDSILEGFTISNGTGTWFDTLGISAYFGGGIFCCDSASPVIRGNIITNNIAQDPAKNSGGGGIDCQEFSSPLIEKNTIINNTANWGGGIEAVNSSPTIIDNLISDNIVNADGGGIELLQSDSDVMNNVISYNAARNGAGLQLELGIPFIHANEVHHNASINNGGGIRCWDTAAFVESNLIHTNTANCGGGMMCQEYASPEITNNWIYDNTAIFSGGGLSFWTGSYPIIVNNTIFMNKASKGGGLDGWKNTNAEAVNTILWNNIAQQGKQIYLEDAILSISYSDVEGGQSEVYVDPGSYLDWGPGMIDEDPLLRDPMNGNFHLTYDSPCIEAGDNYAPALPYADIDDDRRIFPGNGTGYLVGSPPTGAVVDMGADEFCMMKRQKFVLK